MLLKSWWIFFLTLFSISCFGQLKPDYFPEDIPEGINGTTCIFCQPGVRNKSRSRGIELAYGINSRSTYMAESTPLIAPFPTYNRVDYLLFDLKVPVIIKDHFKFLISYKFSREKYDFSQFGSLYTNLFSTLGADALKSNSFGLILSKSLNETSYFALQLKYTSNGNYTSWMQFNDESALYKFRAIYGIKQHDDFEWGIGLSLTQSFRRFSALPFLVFNKNIRDNWGIEAILPAVIYARYNLNNRNIFLFGPKYNSRSYRITNEENALDYAYNHSNLTISFRWEKQLVPWIWTHLQAGYQINFSSELESKNNFPSFDADPTDAPFFQFSIFISPPG